MSFCQMTAKMSFVQTTFGQMYNNLKPPFPQVNNNDMIMELIQMPNFYSCPMKQRTLKMSTIV
jgi:hypothetical protein